MTGTNRTIRAALIAGVLVGSSIAPAGENLIPNGDFETSAAGDANRPAGWEGKTHQQAAVAWPAGEGRDGSRCVRMFVDPNDRWAHAWWISDAVPVRPCMAYRVRFHFRAKGHGTPVFSLMKVKQWRLFKGDTDWRAHEDVVVVPADVTETRFSVNNYHRPGKTMWFDDVSLVELPLAESPLTARLAGARRSLAAVERNAKRLHLELPRRLALTETRKKLTAVEAGYEKLASGQAGAEDFKAIDAGLAAVEQAVGDYLLAVWTLPAAPDANTPLAAPAATRTPEAELTPGLDGTARCCVGLAALAGEALEVRVEIRPTGSTRKWPVALRLRSAHGGNEWGAANPLATMLVPPDAPRLLEVAVTPRNAKPGPHELTVHIHVLDRTAQPGKVKLTVQIE